LEAGLNIIAIVQARLGSTRLPNKVLKEINGQPLIGILIDRLSRSRTIDTIVLAIPDTKANLALADFAKSRQIVCVKGSENDVLDRFYQAAVEHKADIVVRITGDCPLMDPGLVDECLAEFQQSQADYLSNISPPTYPDGLDIEVFSYETLAKAWKQATNEYDREHVTTYIRDSGYFKTVNKKYKRDISSLRLTVDEASDFSVVESIIEHFMPDRFFSWEQVLEFQESCPEVFEKNSSLIRNEGAVMGTGQKLWKRAKDIIPGGNMLLSKRAEMFLPEKWPAYFSRAKGCRVWDLDDNEYIDMSIMGIGTNILGYGHPEVDKEVNNVIAKGNMSTFNCPEEVYLAERLVELHPWADMVRFGRTGGESNAVAVRIGRAASGKDKVAICGYHGWHDWYLSANLGNDSSLDGHLLPGLEAKGVPRNLVDTVYPFTYNNFTELEALVEQHDIGVIKMEVSRNFGPEDNFLQKVRQLATDKNIVLVFDECTSGFRETFGGLHKKYGVDPDIAIFGKALGNGYSITAIIGRREIMDAAQSTFISSTFWTERIGPAAALKSLEVMEKMQSWKVITEKGKNISSRWKLLGEKYDLPLVTWGLPALSGFTITGEDSLAYKTYITQEMLKQGILASNCVYVCTEHSSEVVDRYFEFLDPMFATIKECGGGGEIMQLLESPVCHGSFKRLN
jgi:glutamate-1-semialdehyde 2,1-aminomutase